jgi:hypothetical protein
VTRKITLSGNGMGSLKTFIHLACKFRLTKGKSPHGGRDFAFNSVVICWCGWGEKNRATDMFISNLAPTDWNTGTSRPA